MKSTGNLSQIGSESLIDHHWWPLLRWNGSLLWELHWMVTPPQLMLDGLQLLSEPPFPSGFEAKLFWFQVKLLNWVPSCCSFQHLFVVYTMNWNPPCIVSKILGTTFMRTSLCVLHNKMKDTSPVWHAAVKMDQIIIDWDSWPSPGRYSCFECRSTASWC